MDAHIAVCITTRNRYEVFKKTLFMHGKFRPDNSSLFVVDDASDKPIRIGGNFFRFDENVGVATAKNKCLELADKWGADHIFLFDSDCHPISPDWHLPYINSGQKHLMYNFRLPNKPKTDMQEIHRDDKITAWTHTRGALLYIHRSVLDVSVALMNATSLTSITQTLAIEFTMQDSLSLEVWTYLTATSYYTAMIRTARLNHLCQTKLGKLIQQRIIGCIKKTARARRIWSINNGKHLAR